MDRMPGMPPTPMALAVVEVATQTAAAMAVADHAADERKVEFEVDAEHSGLR